MNSEARKDSVNSKIKNDSKPLSFYLKAHAKYILPTWVFPVYFVVWGEVCQWLIPNDNNVALALFFIFAGVPFFGVFIWSHRVRKEMPYWKYVFLTMAVPFLIFGAITVILAIGQLILEMSGHK